MESLQVNICLEMTPVATISVNDRCENPTIYPIFNSRIYVSR